MSQLIEDVLIELKKKYGITKYELEAILNSEFKCLENNIRSRSDKTVNMIYLGKFHPSKFFLSNYEKISKPNYTNYERYKYKKYIEGLEKQAVENTDTTGGGEKENL